MMDRVYFSMGKKLFEYSKEMLETCNEYINVPLRFVPYFKHSKGSTNTSLNDHGVKTIERR